MIFFIRKLISFFVPLVIIFSCTELLLRYIPNDYSFKSQYLKHNSNDVEVLLLGSSHTYYGINPKFLKLKSFNASYVWQSLSYDYEIFKMYNNKLKKLRYIVVPVDYFSLFTSTETSAEDWRVKNYNIYYGIRRWSYLKYFLEITTLTPQENIARLNSYYVKGIKNTTCNEFGWGESYSSTVKNDLNLSGLQEAKSHTVIDKDLYKKNLKYLQSLIKIADRSGVRVILITCPAYKTYTNNLDSRQLKLTEKTVSYLVERYSNVSHSNFLSDSSFNQNDFYDADHLNEIGAKKFSKKIDSILNVSLCR